MATSGYRFDRFHLDPANRRLSRDDGPVEMNSRYLDALLLLVRERGNLVTKDRFMEEVWRGVPVTDEALTQCIRTLRRQLGDDAARPRFIETVPKHGYRFIAEVASVEGRLDAEEAVADAPAAPPKGREFLLLGGAGTMGAGVAGVVGGVIYGFAAASQTTQPGTGAVSLLLVLTCITLFIALLGGAGVSFGIAAAGRLSPARPWQGHVIGGAVGGMVVGAVVKLLGLDAFTLLFGQSPGDITGAVEGALLGGAVGFGAWLARRGAGAFPLRRGIAVAALCGGAGGFLITLLGGRLMAGSLDLFAATFPESRLRLDPIGSLFGETGLGPIAQVATGALEGMLFAGCIVGGMALAQRALGRSG